MSERLHLEAGQKAGSKASVRVTAPTTYCSKLGSRALLPTIPGDNAIKQPKTPKQTRKAAQGRDKGLFTHQHFKSWQVLITLFLEITLLSLTPLPPPKEIKTKGVFQHPQVIPCPNPARSTVRWGMWPLVLGNGQ